MNVKMEPDYISMAQNAWPMVNQATSHYGGPMGLLGKVVGLSEGEMKAGIPYWGWAGMGLVAGAVLGFTLRHKIERML